eukprot:Nitzschia sp. Nitz4//scaffold37_size175936//53521//54906//NITZ4_002037-RA/size175936-processed-gene-0.217-mRNA-1//-1//CDS//3329549761//2127//frame0
MDLVLNDDGFLVPRDAPNLGNNTGDDDEASFDFQQLNNSLASIPYCKLMDSEMDKEPPMTPSAKNQKSTSTLTTAALTRTVADSQSGDYFATPRSKARSAGNLFRTPLTRSKSDDRNPLTCLSPEIPTGVFLEPGFGDSQVSMLMSPLKTPSPRKPSKAKATSPVDPATGQKLPLPLAVSEEPAMYIPGITSPSGNQGKPRAKAPPTPMRAARGSNLVDFASPNKSSSRLSMVVKELETPTEPVDCARRSRSRPRAQSVGRRRHSSPPTSRPAAPTRKVGKVFEDSFTSLDDRPPTPVKRKSRNASKSRRSSGSINLLRSKPSTSIRSRRRSPPPPTPSSSSKTSRSHETGATHSSSTGRTSTLHSGVSFETEVDASHPTASSFESYSDQSKESVTFGSSRRGSTSTATPPPPVMWDRVGGLPLAEEEDSPLNDDDVSEAGAVIVRTRKVRRSTRRLSQEA